MTAVRSATFLVMFYLWSVAWVLIIFPLIIGPTRWMVASWTVWVRVIMWLLRVICGVRIEVRGRQYMPTGGALIAAKHQSMFDVFAQFAWLPASCFITKQELMWIPFFGWYARKAHMIEVDRAGHSAALRKMVADARSAFAHGRQVVIFPEGTRTLPGETGDYKPGIAALYRELDVPVSLLALNTGVHWPLKGLNFKPGLIVFEYLEPIPPGLKRAEFMRTLQERIETASAALLVR